MSEILVISEQIGHKSAGYFPGDVIACFPDNHSWGEMETNGRQADPENNEHDRLAGHTPGIRVVTLPVHTDSHRHTDPSGNQIFKSVPVTDTLNPHFRIFRLPNVPEAIVEQLLTPFFSSDQPGVQVCMRHMTLDFSKVTDPGVLAFWGDRTRSSDSYLWEISGPDFQKLITPKPSTLKKSGVSAKW